MILGVSLPALAKRIGYLGDAYNDILAFCEMGLVLFPNSDVLQERIREITRYREKKEHFKAHPDELIALIIAQVPTRRTWQELGVMKCQHFKIQGIGMKAIGTILGVTGVKRKRERDIADEITGRIYPGDSSDS